MSTERNIVNTGRRSVYVVDTWNLDVRQKLAPRMRSQIYTKLNPTVDGTKSWQVIRLGEASNHFGACRQKLKCFFCKLVNTAGSSQAADVEHSVAYVVRKAACVLHTDL